MGLFNGMRAQVPVSVRLGSWLDLIRCAQAPCGFADMDEILITWRAPCMSRMKRHFGQFDRLLGLFNGLQEIWISCLRR